MTKATRDTILAIALLLLLVAGGLFAAGLRVQLPAIHVAEGFQALLGGIAGLAIITAGIALIYLGIRRIRATIVLAGVVVLLIGLPLVGVVVGLPAAVAPFFGLLQAIVDLLNLLLGAAS
jgi:hypothetical protein